MPDTYPPIIRSTDFPEPPEVAIVQACQYSHQTCGIDKLELMEHPGRKEDHTDHHRPLFPDSEGRYVFAPGVETFRIGWTLKGHQYITETKLELFIVGQANPVWTKRMRWAEGDRRATGSTRFNGNLRNDYEVSDSNAGDVAVVGPGDGAVFPERLLTAERAPYKLMMSIVAVEPYTAVTVAKRWIYLDVVASVELILGETAMIPDPPMPTYRQTRRRNFNVNTHQALRDALDASSLRLDAYSAPANLKIMLEHNVFAKSSRDFYNNTIYRGSFEVWDNGPDIPLVATVRIQKSDGSLATPAQGAPAIGRLGLYWDWRSAPRPQHPSDTAQAHVQSVLRYKADVWPHAADNCHVDHGGKRGIPNAHFEIVPDMPAPADALTAAAARPWGTFTQPVVDPDSIWAAQSAVLLKPSRIGGDSYRPTVYITYPRRADFDTANAVAFANATEAAPSACSTSVLTVWRQVNVAHHWRKQVAMATGDLVWADVADYFKPAFIHIVPPAAVGDITDPDYQTALLAVAARLPVGITTALVHQNQQHAGEYALTFKTYDAYRADVAILMDRAKRTLALVDPQTTEEVLQAQRLGRARRYDDLVIPDLRTYRADVESIVDRVLRDAGVNGESNYRNKLPSWSEMITEKVCDHLAGTIGVNLIGIQLFQFNFTDSLNQSQDSAVAASSHANRANCPSCNAALARAYPPGYKDESQKTANRICGNCGFRLDDSCIVVSYVPFRYMSGRMDDWAETNLTFSQKMKIRAGGAAGTTAALCIAHEIGHQLGMPHAPQGVIPVFSSSGGKYPGFHDADDDACLMSYNFRHARRMHFCSICTLRLSGWSAGPTEAAVPHSDSVSDGATVPLYSKGEHNYALYTAPGAVWQPEAGVNQCAHCNTAFSLTVRKHHCRACGQVVCATCSAHTALVHSPLSSSGSSIERVCTDCELIAADPKVPAPTAFWQPDESASTCPRCNTEFSNTVARHHCGVCGKLRCNTCSPRTAQVLRPVKNAAPENVRVCNRCYAGY